MKIAGGARRLIDGMSILIVTCTAAILIGTRIGSSAPPPTNIDADRRVAISAALSSGQVLGAAQAPVKLLLFTNYTCRFCQIFDTTLVNIQRRYPDHVAIVIKHFMNPRTNPAIQLAQAGLCARRQVPYGAFYRTAMTNERLISAIGGWREIARRAGVDDIPAVRDCIVDGSFLDLLERDYAEGQQLGVSSTPTIFVGSQKIEGAIPLEALDSIVALQLRSSRN